MTWFYSCKSEKKFHILPLVNGEARAIGPAEQRVFATTRWSVVLSAAGTDEETSREALAELCRIYWRPIFSFVCRHGHSIEEAQDLTQDFFVMILESDWLQQADQHRGRFRSFMLKSVQNFLSHAKERSATLKRGGNMDFISWDAWMAEAPSQLAISSQTLDSLAPERIFDLRWAAGVVEHALRRLREECEGKGRLRLFETLRTQLAAEHSDISYADLAAALGIADTAVKKQLHNLRQRYRWILRDEVADTVNDPSDVDDEIRHLCAVLAADGT